MCACTYCLFAARMWHPLVSVITTLYYAAIIFHHRELTIARFLYAVHVLKFGHHPYPLGQLCFFVASIAEIGHGEKSGTQSHNHSLNHSPSLFDELGTEACTLESIFR